MERGGRLETGGMGSQQQQQQQQQLKMQGSPPPWQTVWRGVHLLMVLFFLLAALANINDDDWYLWVPIYAVPVLFSVPVIIKASSSGHWLWRAGTVVYLTLCLAYALYQVVALVEAVQGRVENPLQHEEGREMGGLLIIICWIAMIRFTSFGRAEGAPSNRGLMSALLLMTVTLALLPLLTWAACFVGDWHTRLGHCKGMFRQ